MQESLHAELRDKSATIKPLQQHELNRLRQQRELEAKQAALALKSSAEALMLE